MSTALQSPIEYQRKEGVISVTRPLSSGRPPSAPPTPNGHAPQPPPDSEQEDQVWNPHFSFLMLHYKFLKNFLTSHDVTFTPQELVLVLQDFAAVREDEISVFRGEKVQILASNQQGQSLVYRPANTDSPAAEGWVPRSILNTHWHIHMNKHTLAAGSESGLLWLHTQTMAALQILNVNWIKGIVGNIWGARNVIMAMAMPACLDKNI